MEPVITVDLALERYLAPFQGQRLPFYRFDVVVLGSGVAGASAALAATAGGGSVALVSKDRFSETNTTFGGSSYSLQSLHASRGWL